MNKRQRKKWLKKHNQYINPKDCWNLDVTIADFIIPRLKKFKKDTNGYPATLSSFEEWQNILDKIITAFEYVAETDLWWINDPKYNYISGCKIDFVPCKDNPNKKKMISTEKPWVAGIKELHRVETLRRSKVIKEGLQLFAEYYNDLWW